MHIIPFHRQAALVNTFPLFSLLAFYCHAACFELMITKRGETAVLSSHVLLPVFML